MKKIALIALIPFALAACNEAAEEPAVVETAVAVETLPADIVSSDPVVAGPATEAADEATTGTPEPVEKTDAVPTNAPG